MKIALLIIAYEHSVGIDALSMYLVSHSVFCEPCLECAGKDDSLSDDVKKEDIKNEADAKSMDDDDIKAKAIKEEIFDEHKKVKLDDSDMSVDKMENVNFSDVLQEEMDKLMADNKQLENLVTEFHQRHHEITIKVLSIVNVFALLWFGS